MSIRYVSDEEVKSAIVEAFMPHLEQVPHSPGLFLDGYYYRPKHQDSLSLAIDDATVALADLCSKIIAGEDE
jgi:hypothetical protein